MCVCAQQENCINIDIVYELYLMVVLTILSTVDRKMCFHCFVIYPLVWRLFIDFKRNMDFDQILCIVSPFVCEQRCSNFSIKSYNKTFDKIIRYQYVKSSQVKPNNTKQNVTRKLNRTELNWTIIVKMKQNQKKNLHRANSWSKIYAVI